MNVTRSRLPLDSTVHFSQLAVNTNTTRLRNMRCEANMLPDHHANSANIRARSRKRGMSVSLLCRLFAFAALSVVVVWINGCATLSKGECLTANWYLLGRHDGSHGYTRARLYEHRQACAQYGVIPDAQAYYAGRRVGLERYCTPRNGFREGRAGHEYRDVCPLSSETAFLKAYRKGKAIHEVAEEIEEVENTIDSLEARLSDEDTPDSSRDEIRAKLRGRFRELRHLNRKLTRLKRRYGRGLPPLFD